MISLLRRILSKKYHNIVTYNKLKRLKEKSASHEVIKVGFIVQMTQIWDKQEPVFDEMIKDEQFAPKLIVSPMFDYVNNKVCEFGKEKDYFVDKYGDDLCLLYDNNFDVNCLNEFDYIFYQRPYDVYLPIDLRSYKMIDYCKTVYIPYSYSCSEAFNKLETSDEFFRNIYLGFIDIEGELDILKKRYKRNIRKGVQQFPKLGYPAFEKYLDCHDGLSEARVLWTPRWSTDEVLGGSHFLEYKDDFIALMKEFKDCKLKLRPHPLMFDHLLQKGLMNEQEIDDYKKELDLNNIEFSKNAMIEDDFRHTDILLSDPSSVVVEFFMSGKPIIYCPANREANKEYKAILEGLYIAETWEDVMVSMRQLLNGQDPLKDKREEILRNNYSNVRGSAKRIVEYIKNEYNS